MYRTTLLALALVSASAANAKAPAQSAGITIDDNGHVTHVSNPVVKLCDYAREMSVSLNRGKLTLKGGSVCKDGEVPTVTINAKTCVVSDGTIYGQTNLNCS